MSVPVVLAAPGLPGETDLVAALARPGAQVTVVRRCVDAIDLVGAAASGCAHAAVVSPSLPRLARDTIARLADARVGVLGVVAPGDDAGERTLRDLQVDRVVVLSPGDLQRSIGRIASAVRETESAVGNPSQVRSGVDSDPGVGDVAVLGEGLGEALGDGDVPTQFGSGGHSDSGQGSLVAVWGPHGAPGRTTVAIGLSDEIARSGGTSLLVDADTQGGAVAQSLGILDEVSGIAVACRHADAGSLDALTLAQAARSLDHRWRVLTGLPRSERWIELRGPAIARVWEVARALPGVTVADIGAGLDVPGERWAGGVDRFAAAHTAIEAADTVIVVGSADPIGIERLIDGLDIVRQRTNATTRVVVNKVRRGPLGRDPQGQVREALARHAGVTDAVFIADDRDSLDTALREGRTLAECAPRSTARQALRTLAEEIAATLINIDAA